ncbi:unnamed protein product [Larinioides sclopetarius]|uniref:Uncharacterized protein n=1 Tax=Larinioides sclopetarius TaxID=280406 RepID=A0AAV2BBY3_9ARAC
MLKCKNFMILSIVVCIWGLQTTFRQSCLLFYSSQTLKMFSNALLLLVAVIATLHALASCPGKKS